jgi:tetratricopeptide (TPR) repeat protein
MLSLYDFSSEIFKLHKDKKYQDTLNYFRENKTHFTPEEICTNRYIVSGVISSLIELNHYEAVFSFVEQYHIIIDPKNFPYLLKDAKDKVTPNWNFISRLCDLISVESLSTECRTIEVVRKGEKKEMGLASNKEDWYAAKAKALFETHRYQECYEISKQALDLFEVFHYSNDIWFARRIALCKKNLGNSTDAIAELQQVLKRKKAWFIQKELAALYHEVGDNNKAFKFAIDAINNFGDLEYKVGLLMLLGELLKEKQENDLAFKHFSLSSLLRIKEEWSIPPELRFAFSQFQNAPIPIEKLQDLKSELKQYWNTFIPKPKSPGQSPNQHLSGKISIILHNNERGVYGKIKFDGNKLVYFIVNANEEIIPKLKVGLEVEFKLIPASSDKKEKAIHLKIKQ